MMNKEVVVLAAAAAVISGTILLLASRFQKSLHHHSSPPILQSCISSASDEKKKKKKKKRVHFAEDVIGSSRTRKEERNGEVIRNYRMSSETKVRNGGNEENRGMPANRVALYNGILRDRAAQRLAHSY